MTDQQHPITPPIKLVDQWADKYQGHMPEWILRHVAAEAAQWGADQELEASVNCLIESRNPVWAHHLREARRPKPPTLNSIALQMLGTIEQSEHFIPEITDTIRRALEQLND
jgi:hypothetical protein